MRALTLPLEEFAASAVESTARRYSLSPSELVALAARYYVADPSSNRLSRRVPDYVSRGARGEPLEVELDLDDAGWRSLLAEAKDQGVPIERLLEHAVMYFVADLDSGRAVGQLLDV